MPDKETIISRDLGDVLDRLSIAKLKSERIGSEDSKKEYAEFKKFLDEKQKKYPQYEFHVWLDIFVKVNSAIWLLEAALKSGKTILPNPHWLDDKKNSRALSHIGKSSIQIREYNGVRVALKNMVNDIVKEGFQDQKKDHGSE